MRPNLLSQKNLLVILLGLLCSLSCSKKEAVNPTPTTQTNTAPKAQFTVDPTSGDVNTVFTFDASSCSDAETNSSSLQVRWDFNNDGTFETSWSTSKVMTGTFPEAAEYGVKLEVKDAAGSVHSTMKTVSVSSATYTDSRDGKVYETVRVDERVWMIQNLAFEISGKQITDASSWASNATLDGWCYYNNESELKTESGSTYGILYQWEAAKLAIPDGWHIPSEVEFRTLVESLGGESVAGGKLKEIGTEHWKSPNAGATDEVGYTALPGGYRSIQGVFEAIGEYGTWWTSTEVNGSEAWGCYLSYEDANAEGSSFDKRRGMAIRLIKDLENNTAPIASFTISPETGEVGTSFSFSASNSSDGESSTSNLYVRWDFNNDGVYDTEWTKTKTVNHTYSVVDTYTVKLQVEDEGGLTNTITKDIVVTKANTEPEASFTVNKTSGDLGTLFSFDASASTDEESALEDLLFRWDFNNDGTFDLDWSNANTTTHTFSSAGTQTIVLEVKDEGGLIDRTTKSVEISSLFTDNRNGNSYSTVAIGDQLWFSENLNYETGTWWWFLDNYDSYGFKYARLYDWETAKVACPDGWHLPTDDDWKELEVFLGMSQDEVDKDRTRGTDEGKKLKASSGWNSNNGTNSTGFNALAAGYYKNDNDLNWAAHEYYAAFWTSTETSAAGSDDVIYGWTRMLFDSSDGISRNKKLKTYGLSVRCVRD